MNERLPLLASRSLRALQLLAVAGGLLLLVLAASRLTIEWFWFAEFRAQRCSEANSAGQPRSKIPTIEIGINFEQSLPSLGR